MTPYIYIVNQILLSRLSVQDQEAAITKKRYCSFISITLFIFNGSTMPINIRSFLNDKSAYNILRLNETFLCPNIGYFQ